MLAWMDVRGRFILVADLVFYITAHHQERSNMAILDESRPQPPAFPDKARLHSVIAAVVLLVLMFLGFQQFYLHGRAYPGQELPPPIRTLLIVHGLGMTAWGLLFLLQASLIATSRRALHRQLGVWGAGLAAGLALMGWHLGIEAARITPPDMRIAGLLPPQFLAVPIFNISAFAAFVAVGVWQRRRPDVHKPMMLLATVAVMSAAISRIDALSALYQGTVWETLFGPFFGMLMFGGWFLAQKRWLTGIWDFWYAIGYAGLAVYCAFAIWLAKTEAWGRWAGFMMGE